MAMDNSVVRKIILRYLPRRDVLNYRLINKSFQEDTRLYFKRHFYINLDSTLKTPENLVNYTNLNGLVPAEGINLQSLGPNVTGLLELATVYGSSTVMLKVKDGIGYTDNEALLKCHFPNLRSLQFLDFSTTSAFLRNTEQLGVVDLDIRSTTFNTCGEGATSLVLGCRSLNRLAITGPNFPSSCLIEMAERGGFSHLSSLSLEGKFESAVFTIFKNCARSKNFNSLTSFLLRELEYTSPQSLLDVYEFLGMQVNCSNLFLSSLVCPTVQNRINLDFMTTNISSFNQISNLANLQKLQVTPIFQIVNLSKCKYINTIVLSSIFDLTSFSGDESALIENFKYMFRKTDDLVLTSVKTLKLVFCISDPPDRKVVMDLILSWFPSISELEVIGYHPECLVSIWGSKELRKLKLQLLVAEWNFNFDVYFTGHTSMWCEFCRGYDVNMKDWVFEEKPTSSILDLKVLESVEIEFIGRNVGPGNWNQFSKDDLKLSDVSVIHAIGRHHTLKHFDISADFAYEVCVEMSDGCRVLLAQQLYDPLYRMRDIN